MALRTLWAWAGWVLAGVIVYLSLTPTPPEPVTFDNADKFEHALAYGTLELWFCQLYENSRMRVVASCAALGVVLEYVQGWTGYRTFDVLDMAADSAGALAGWMAVYTPLGGMLRFFERTVNKMGMK